MTYLSLSDQRISGGTFELPQRHKPKSLRSRFLPIRQQPTIFHVANQAPEQANARRTFLIDNIPIEYALMRAPRERGVIVAFSGFKSAYPFRQKTVEKFHEEGLSVIWMALPNPGTSLGFIRFFKKCALHFLLHPNSPVHTEFDENITRILHGHSAGGLLASRWVFGTSTSQNLLRRHFKAATLDADFVDCARASIDDNKWLVAFHTLHCLKNPHKLPQETKLGLLFFNYNARAKKVDAYRPPADAPRAERISFQAALILSAAAATVRQHLNTGLREKFLQENGLHDQNAFRTPTCGQTLELRNEGRHRIRKVVAGRTQAAIPTLMTAGRLDYYSSTSQIEKIAHIGGAKFYLAEAQHNPIDEDPAALTATLQFIRPHLPEWTVEEKAPVPAEETPWPEFERKRFDIRGHGARLLMGAKGMLSKAFGFGQRADQTPAAQPVPTKPALL